MGVIRTIGNDARHFAGGGWELSEAGTVELGRYLIAIPLPLPSTGGRGALMDYQPIANALTPQPHELGISVQHLAL